MSAATERLPDSLTAPWRAWVCVNCGWNTPVAIGRHVPGGRCPECSAHHPGTAMGRLVEVQLRAEPVGGA